MERFKKYTSFEEMKSSEITKSANPAAQQQYFAFIGELRASLESLNEKKQNLSKKSKKK